MPSRTQFLKSGWVQTQKNTWDLRPWLQGRLVKSNIVASPGAQAASNAETALQVLQAGVVKHHTSALW